VSRVRTDLGTDSEPEKGGCVSTVGPTTLNKNATNCRTCRKLIEDIYLAYVPLDTKWVTSETPFPANLLASTEE